MRFGSVDTFVGHGDWGSRMGRPIANESFLQALLQHGTWDAYHFFCPDAARVALFTDRVRELVPDDQLLSRVFAAPVAHLPSTLGDVPFDVFHQGDFTYFHPYLAALRNREGHRPFAISGVTHSLDGVHMHQRFVQLALSGLRPSDAIVCTSDAAVKMVRAKIAEVRALLRAATGADLDIPVRTPCIPLGIDDAQFDDTPRYVARAALAIPAERTVVLSVGRLSYSTKTDWSPILERLARDLATGALPSLLWVIAGGSTDSEIALLQGLIDACGLTNTVVLFPNFTPATKSALYRAADIYVSLVDNYQETFGINLIEAMAAGLPVIASDFDGYRDAITENENGLLVPTVGGATLPDFLDRGLGLMGDATMALYLAQSVACDLDRFSAALQRLATEPHTRERLGDAGRRRAERYRWRRVIADYEALWAELAPAARTERAPTRAARDLATGDGIRAFAHYPSRLLQPGDRVSLTSLGTALMRDANLVHRYDEIALVASPELERLILVSLAAEGVLPVAALHTRGAARLDATPGDVDFQLLWLLKHGAVRLEG